jgi:hypothetical protein
MGMHMSVRRWSTGTVLALGFVVIAPATASADPSGTPAGTGGGCARNGAAVSTFAQAPGPYGQLAKDFTPIADDVAAFFGTYC